MAQLIIPALITSGSLAIGTPATFALIGASATATTIGANLLATAIIVGGSYVLADRSTPQGITQSLDLRQRFDQDSNPPRRIVYGRARFAPSVIHATSPQNTAGVRVAAAISDHALGTLHGIYIDSDLLLTPDSAPNLFRRGSAQSDGSTAVSAGQEINTSTGGLPERVVAGFAGYTGLIANFFVDLGAENPGDPNRFEGFDLSGISPSLELRYSGVAMLTFNLEGNSVWGGIPNISVDVERDKTSLRLPEGADPAWRASNAALCAYDYLSRYTAYGRTVLGSPLIDVASVLEAAEMCHARNFEANGVLFLTDEPASIMDQFALAMGGGMFIERAGVVSFRTGVEMTSAPPVILNRGEQVGANWAVSPAGDFSTRPTAIEVIYTNVEGSQESEIAGAETSSPSRIETLEATLINNSEQAEIASRATLRARRVNRVVSLRYILTPDSPEWLLRLDVGDLAVLPQCLTQPPSDTNPGERHKIVEIELNSDGTRTIRAARLEPESA